MLIKLKANIPEIILGVFLAIAVFVMGTAFESFRYAPSNIQTQQSANNGGTKITADYVPDKITDWLLVILNFFLVSSTLLLWWVTKTAADATKKAAEAAAVSAGSIAVVERAYVYPVIVGHGAIGDCIKNARIFYEGDPSKDDKPADETAEITFKFKNFGKTPALLKTAFAGLGVAPLGAKIGLPIVESVLGAGEETITPFVSDMQIGITRRQAQHILAYTGHVCFEGRVTFDDIWGNEQTTKFYFVWDHWISRMNLRWVETKTKYKSERDAG